MRFNWTLAATILTLAIANPCFAQGRATEITTPDGGRMVLEVPQVQVTLDAQTLQDAFQKGATYVSPDGNVYLDSNYLFALGNGDIQPSSSRTTVSTIDVPSADWQVVRRSGVPMAGRNEFPYQVGDLMLPLEDVPNEAYAPPPTEDLISVYHDMANSDGVVQATSIQKLYRNVPTYRSEPDVHVPVRKAVMGRKVAAATRKTPTQVVSRVPLERRYILVAASEDMPQIYHVRPVSPSRPKGEMKNMWNEAFRSAFIQ